MKGLIYLYLGNDLVGNLSGAVSVDADNDVIINLDMLNPIIGLLHGNFINIELTDVLKDFEGENQYIIKSKIKNKIVETKVETQTETTKEVLDDTK